MHASTAPPNHAAPGWATDASAPVAAPPATEIYHVVFAPDDIREITLEQLDDCYRLGVIDESTRMWTEGMSSWQTLGAAAGLEQPEPEFAPPSGSRRRTPPPRRRAAVSGTAAQGTAGHALPAAVPSTTATMRGTEVYTPATVHQSGPVWSRGNIQFPLQGNEGYGESAPQPQMRQPPKEPVHPVPSQVNNAWQTAQPPVVDPVWQSPQTEAQRGKPAAAWGARPVSPGQHPLDRFAITKAPGPGQSWQAAEPRMAQPQPAQHNWYGAGSTQQVAQPQPAQHNWYGAGSTQQAAQPQPVQHNWYGAGSTQQAAQPQQMQHNRYDAVVAQQQPQHAGLQHQQPVGAVYQQPRPAQPVLQSQYPAPVAAATLAPMARESFDSTVFSKSTGMFRGRVQSLLLWGCLVSGAAITLYRNDVLLKGARQLNQETAFLKLEKQWLGGAPTGTPRQVKALTSQATSAAPATAGDAPLSAGSRENREATGADDSSAARISDANSRAAETGASVNQLPANPSTDDEGASSKSASSNAAALSPSQGEPGRTSGESVKAERAQQSPTPAAKRVSATRSKPARSTPRVRSAKAAANKPSKVEQKPSSATPMPAAGSDDFLRMSMRNAVKEAKVKKKAAKSAKQKKKSEGASSYDPLNGEL